MLYVVIIACIKNLKYYARYLKTLENGLSALLYKRMMTEQNAKGGHCSGAASPARRHGLPEEFHCWEKRQRGECGSDQQGETQQTTVTHYI